MPKTRKKQRSRAEIAAILDRYEASGLTQRAFAKRNRLSVSTLQWWLRRNRTEQSSKPTTFVPVTIADTATASRLELELSDGRRVWIPADFDGESLASLLPVITAAC